MATGPRLTGKRAVVTGGASGIGLATARRLREEGADVAIFDRSPADIASEFGADRVLEVDVSDARAVAEGFRKVDSTVSGVDVLIANAGMSKRQPVLDITPDDWREVIETNLSGVFYCAREAAARMTTTGGGVILMTASTNGKRGHPFYAHYNASKAGVILLAQTMARELAPDVRVNAVCPGYVWTPMQAAEYTPEMLEAVNSEIPLGRHADPEEVAALFAYLASNEAAYITGQAVAIDGGELA